MGTPRKMKNKRKSVAMDKEYQLKRQRNNDAVRKSREKAKHQAEQTALRVKKLRQENEALEERLKLLSKELAFLKDIFKTHTGMVLFCEKVEKNVHKFTYSRI